MAADIDSGWDDNYTPSQRPAQSQYSSYSDRYTDDDLDQGWDSTDNRPTGYIPPSYPEAAYERKTYSDDLYGAEEVSYDDLVEEGPEELIDSDGVYEADYRVIKPPSRPLDTDEDY